MNKNPKRVRPQVTLLILLLGAAAILAAFTASRSAYEACRAVMLNADGYGIWKLESTRFFAGGVQYDFNDGYNIATCEAVGFGKFWIGTKKMETLVGCMLSLDDTGGKQCPRAKFGVTP